MNEILRQILTTGVLAVGEERHVVHSSAARRPMARRRPRSGQSRWV